MRRCANHELCHVRSGARGRRPLLRRVRNAGRHSAGRRHGANDRLGVRTVWDGARGRGRTARLRYRHRLGTAFCWGLPERGRGRVPCRLIDDVLPWPVPPDYGDPQLLPSLIRALAMGSFAALCPVYDSTSVQEATATWVGGEVAPRPTFERLLGDLDVDIG